MTRQNRKIAVSWAKKSVKTNNVVISDQYFTCVENFDQADAVVNKLAKNNILVFQGPGKTGAVLVHKHNKDLDVTHMDIASDRPHLDKEVCYAGTLGDGKDGNIMLLSPWQLTFAYCESADPWQ